MEVDEEMRDVLQKQRKLIFRKENGAGYDPSGCLNWCYMCTRLEPVDTLGDGNCLLHSIAFSVGKANDCALVLRKQLYDYFTSISSNSAFYRKWKWEFLKENKQGNAWVLLEENQWSSEWSKVVSMTSIEPIHSETRRTRSGATYASSNTYSSLEGIHISAISNLIKRPVIVVTDDIIHDLRGRALAPNNLGGVYLPSMVETKFPVVLCYNDSHFTPTKCVSSEHQTQSTLPLCNAMKNPLKLKFFTDPGADFNWRERDLEHMLVLENERNYSNRTKILEPFLNLTTEQGILMTRLQPEC